MILAFYPDITRKIHQAHIYWMFWYCYILQNTWIIIFSFIPAFPNNIQRVLYEGKPRKVKAKTLTWNWRDHWRTGTQKHTETVSRYFDRHGRLYRVFTNFYSLPIDKDGHACQNISIQFQCVFVCLSFSDLFNFWLEFSLSFPLFCDIRTSVLSFPRGLGRWNIEINR